MPIYVTLLKNTAKGAREIKDFGKSVEEAAGWITRDGGKVLGAYVLQGHYDFLWITEYPDTKGIGKSLLSAAARGLVVTETLEALPIDQFVSLLNSPSMTERFGQIKS
ncbi:MAG TPA: GYD domain-containing protein [Blastocatellia bacterium]|nr:GYD domain-containing protein [Blastocatellia bacterium]